MWLDRNVLVMMMIGFSFLFHIDIGAVLIKIRSLPCSHLLIYYGVGDLRKPPLRSTLVWPYVINIQSNLPMQSPVGCIKRSPFSCSVIENSYWTSLRGHLSYKATSYSSQRWPLNTGLTTVVDRWTCFSAKRIVRTC